MSQPHDQFLADATNATADAPQRDFLRKALGGYYNSRDTQKARYRDWEHARDAAALAKWNAVNRLDRTLTTFAANFERNGGKVHWARDGAEARAIISQICREAGAKAVIKSKCMTTEEIHLNDALEAEELTMIARRHLRQLYVDADVGISGANFLVAETGQVSITENEGNARLTCALPRVHIALAGIEKVIDKLDDLAVLLPMLATAGAGQPMTCYNTLYAGPRQPGEPDGPTEFHVVLLDNKRTALLADPEQRDALHCIRCGACLNVCPIFKNIGGFAYGTTYQGPIGSVLTPHLRGLKSWNHLSGASSLCGACTEACPVRIDLHHHLLHNRRNAALAHASWFDRIFHGAFGWVIARPRLFALGGRIFRQTLPLLRRLPLPYLTTWLRTRDLPEPPVRSFRDEWKGSNR